jgi:hypothetical protein
VKYALASSAVIALVAVAADVHADDTVIVRREVTVVPSAAFIASGTIALSLGYGVASVIAISSTYDKDRLLFIPLAGPWIDLGVRPPGTTDEVWARVGLIVDGIAQLAGAVLLVTGFVMRARMPKNVAALVTPTSTGLSLSF